MENEEVAVDAAATAAFQTGGMRDPANTSSSVVVIENGQGVREVQGRRWFVGSLWKPLKNPERNAVMRFATVPGWPRLVHIAVDRDLRWLRLELALDERAQTRLWADGNKNKQRPRHETTA